MKRSDAVLRILDKIEDPIRGKALYELLLEEPEGRRCFLPEAKDCAYADFPTMMETLVEEKLVHKFKVDNKVWYYISKQGRKKVRPLDYQNLFKRQISYWIQKLAYLPRWTLPSYKDDVENCKKRIKELVELTENGEVYFHKRLASSYAGMFVRLYKDEYDSRSIKDFRNYISQVVPLESFDKYFKQAIRRVLRREYTALDWEIQQNRREGHNTRHADKRKFKLIELMKSFGPSPDSCKAAVDKLIQKKLARKELCALCYARIHSQEAIEDAKLLEKYTGIKSGAVCCNCHAELVRKEREALGLKSAEFKGAIILQSHSAERRLGSAISLEEFQRLLGQRDEEVS